MLNTHSQERGQDAAVVGSEGKNSPPTKIRCVATMDPMRFSWIFSNEIALMIL